MKCDGAAHTLQQILYCNSEKLTTTSTGKMGTKVKFSHKAQAEKISEEVINPLKSRVLINVST